MGIVKVCFMLANFPPEIFAGTELVVAALGAALRSKGVEVLVLCTSEQPHQGLDVAEESFAGLRVLRLFRRLDEWDQHGLERPRLLRLVGELLQRERPDVLHAHHLAGFGAGQLQQARALGIPSLLTFHDLWVACARFFRLPPPGIVCPPAAGREPCVRCVNLALHHPQLEVVRDAVAARDRSLRAEVAAAAMLTAPSRTAARMVQEHLPWPEPIAVVPHGLLAPVPAGARAPAPQQGERLRIGTFGNLVEQKGVLELLRAVSGLDVELHLHGAFLVPAFEQQVRALAAATAVDLHCHGRYGPQQRHPARSLHLCVFPSRCQETYGLVVDEALAHGVPVVVSDQGALAERASTPGVVVSALPALAATLRGLVTDRDRLSSLRAAVPADLPGIADAAAAYLELYRSVLPARPWP